MGTLEDFPQPKRSSSTSKKTPPEGEIIIFPGVRRMYAIDSEPEAERASLKRKKPKRDRIEIPD